MKASILSACALAVLLWTGAQAMGQGRGQGKGQDKGDAAGVKENAPASNPAQQGPQTVEPSRGKDNAGRKIDANSAGAGRPDLAKGKKGMEGAGEAMKGKGKEHQQQLQAVDKQLRHTQAKQLERQARLARIRELAVQKGDNEMVARVDKLIAKQNEVFSRRQMHLQTQKRAAEQPQMQGQQAPAAPPAQPPAQGEAAKPTEVNKPTK